MKLFWTNVEKVLVERGLTKKELAAGINVTPPHLSYMITGARRTHSDVYNRVIAFLDVDPTSLFMPASYKPAGSAKQTDLNEVIDEIKQEDSELGDALEYFLELNKSDRRTILDVMRRLCETDNRRGKEE